VSLLQTSFYRNSCIVHPLSPRQCNRITESIMSLSTWPLWCFRHYWPWHLDHPSLILAWHPWLCSQLVQIISVISSLPCQMCNWPVFLAHILLQCPPRLCPWSTALRDVHHSSQHPHFLLFPKPPPLCRWHSALPILPSDWLRLQDRSPSQCSRSNFVLDDCKSSYTELLQDWISAHWSQ